MSKLVAPHGGSDLIPLLARSDERAGLHDKARGLPVLRITSREVSDLIMLGIGAYTPLKGFMGEADWRGVCTDMALADGRFWPVPITLSCDADQADGLSPGGEVALVDGETDTIMGILTVEEKYTIDRKLECENVFLTDDPDHPGVAKVMNQGAVNVAGPVVVLSEGVYPERYPELYLRPADARALFDERGWSRVAAFQTRNPMHRSHEYLAKIAIEVCDGVFIHQVLGALKPGDLPAEARTRAIDALVNNYFVPSTYIQAGYPIEMRYAGPREALLHAVLRQNFGCSHLIVGRDHAGVGSYYGPFDAHHIFDKIPVDSLQIEPLKFDTSFYCRRCGEFASSRTCPHDQDDRLVISGTRLREMFMNHEPIPAEFSRPEVLAILQEYYDSLPHPQGD